MTSPQAKNTFWSLGDQWGGRGDMVARNQMPLNTLKKMFKTLCEGCTGVLDLRHFARIPCLRCNVFRSK